MSLRSSVFPYVEKPYYGRLLAMTEIISEVIVHGHCPDGVASAIILNEAFEERVPIRFLLHDSQEYRDLRVQPNMLFCDICPPPDRVDEFLAAGAMVLDHHKSTRHIVERFGERGVYADAKEDPGVSGAMLAYRHVYVPMRGQRKDLHRQRKELYHFAANAGVRDTWQTEDDRWATGCRNASALTFFTTDRWLESRAEERNKLLEVGDAIMDRHIASVRECVANGVRIEPIAGYHLSALVVSRKDVTSDGNDLTNCPLIIGYEYKSAGPPRGIFQDQPLLLSLSMRCKPGWRVDKLCKKWGGGGHKRAAGCAIPGSLTSPNPYQRISEVLREAYDILQDKESM